MGARALLAFRALARDENGILTDDAELGALMVWESIGAMLDLRDGFFALLKGLSKRG